MKPRRCPVCSQPQPGLLAMERHLREHAARIFDEAAPPMTLHAFEQKCGGAEAAAARVGVALSTWLRWSAGEHRPKGNNARRLRELGVQI